MSLFPIIPPAALLPSLALVDSLETNAGGPTFSFTANLGAADASRLIVAVCCWGGDTTRSLSSVSIAGGAATVHLSSVHLGGCGIASRAVAAGTSGTVSFTISAGTGCGALYVYRVVNLASTTPTDTASDNTLGDNVISTAIDVSKNGIIIGGVGSKTGIVAAITGLSIDDSAALDEGDQGCGHYLAAAAETNRALSIDLGGAGSGALAAAAWR